MSIPNGKARVLVVDDSESTRSLICGLLARRGFAVVGEAATVAGAFEATQRLIPDMVLLDVHLPDGNGFDLCARLTAAHARLAVLLVSADRDDAFHHLAEASGARGFVPKSQLAQADLSNFL
ncbi:MAG: PleD family two-component system response regulator [Solirubrobacteraceae bacterium]